MSPRHGREIAAAVLSLLAGSCGDGRSPTTPAATPGTLALRLETAHFRLYTDAAAEPVLRDIAGRLEADLLRFQTDLSVASTPPFTVRVWQDEAAWFAEVQRVMGRRLETMGYVRGPDELRVLVVPGVANNAAHELVHYVTLYVNPSFANNPRWLWESVALWENRQLVDPRTLAYMREGRPPTLAQLDADFATSRQVYEVGYTIGEFVVARGGPVALVRLIQANGDTAVLGLTPSEFETEWYAFVREKYLP